MKSVVKANGGPTVSIKTPRQWVTKDADAPMSRKMRRAFEAAERKGKLIREGDVKSEPAND
jgi:hypothetical protein